MTVARRIATYEARLKALRLGIGGHAERFALLVAWIIVIAVFGFLAPNTFLTTENVTSILGSQTTLVILTLGLLIPLTAGDYDMSAAAVLTLSSMLVAVLNVSAGWPIWCAVIAAVLSGVAVGAVNGFFTIMFDIDPFIVTLGSGTVVLGIVLWISGSNTISGVSGWLSEWIVVRRLAGVPLEFYYGLVICGIVWYVLEFTSVGRRVLFVGRGRNVARLSGIRVGRVRWSCLIASATTAAVAGVVYTGTAGGADPTSGASFLLPAFAAAFLGATTIVPGRFNPWGSFVSVYFLVTGITGLAILGVQTWVENLFYGGALVIAVSISQLVRKRHDRATRV